MTALLTVAAFAPVLFLTAVLIMGWLRHGYDPRDHPVSALALGRGGWMQCVNFILCGVLLTAGGLAMVNVSVPQERWWPTGVIVVILGLGLVFSGAYRMDPMPGYPQGARIPAEPTPAHTMHEHAGSVVFAAMPFVGLIAALTGPLPWWGRVVAAGLGVATVYWGVKFAVGWEKGRPGAGRAQRWTLVLGLGSAAAALALAA